MSKFNRGTAVVAVKSPVVSEDQPTGRTFEGAPGYAREAKSELFLLAVSHLGEDTFYESAGTRDTRLTGLVRQVATEDPEWMTSFARWLRGEAQMRTSSVMIAADALKVMLDVGKPGGRKLVSAALQRADEPGELLAYWRSKYGRKLPIALNRGISDAVQRLYTEFALLKYDSRDAALRFGDVVELVSPRYHNKEYGTWRDALYRYAIERRHNRDNPVPEQLAMIRANAALRQRAAGDPAALLDADALKSAGMTWEDALSLAGSKLDKAKLWAALIPSMGYMALLRNLRNFDEAGVPDAIADGVAARLADPEQVARSRQFPMRFLSAYRSVPSLRWGHPLDRALTASVGNIPSLRGRTLVLVDTSTSMDGPFSKDGKLMRWDAAVLFAVALAAQCEYADVVSFSSTARFWGDLPGANTKPFPLVKAESLLRSLDRWKNGGWFLGGGTATAAALRKHYRDTFHSRTVIITDEQAAQDGREVSQSLPANVPLYTWNLAGYQRGHAPSGHGQRHAFGGLTDSAFKLIPLLESGQDANWSELFGTGTRLS